MSDVCQWPQLSKNIQPFSCFCVLSATAFHEDIDCTDKTKSKIQMGPVRPARVQAVFQLT